MLPTLWLLIETKNRILMIYSSLVKFIRANRCVNRKELVDVGRTVCHSFKSCSLTESIFSVGRKFLVAAIKSN